jgi:hypothetical protein
MTRSLEIPLDRFNAEHHTAIQDSSFLPSRGFDMTQPTIRLLGFCLLAGLAGCAGNANLLLGNKFHQPARPSPEAETVLRHLKHVDAEGRVETQGLYAEERLAHLEAELRQIGARLQPDGKIYDRDGREVYVWEDGAGFGCWPTEEMLRSQGEAREQQLRTLRKKYRVIELPYFGPPAC